MKKTSLERLVEVSTVKQIKKLVDGKVSASLFLSDVLAVSFAFFLACAVSRFIQDHFLFEVGLNSNTYNFLSLIIYPALLTLFYIKGYYTQRVPWWSQVRYIFGICIIAFISDVFIRLVLHLPLSEFFVTSSAMFVFAFILLGRQISCFILNKLGLWQVDTIVIGSIETVTNILYAFYADYYAGYNVKTILLRDREGKEFDIETLPLKYKNLNVRRDDVDYPAFINKNSNNFFVISLETFRGEEKDTLIKKLTNMNILYSVAPPLSSMSLFEMKPHNFFGCDVMLLHSKNAVTSSIKQFLKRSIDIIGAFASLVLLLPVILAVMLFLKLEGQGGSIFYGGDRIGRDGKRFRCWKFRSMEPDSDHLLYELIESDPVIKADWDKFRKLKVADPRITTKTARIIRKTSLDEVPQLWNVLIGDMSIVGPRPILPNEQELLGDSYKNYIKVNPGITGLWQVSGRNDTSFQRRIHLDDWYVRNWSIWGDIVIMIKTLNVVLKGSGSY